MRRICECGRPAITRVNGNLKASRDHDLCFRCFHAERDQQLAARINPDEDDSDRYEYETRGQS